MTPHLRIKRSVRRAAVVVPRGSSGCRACHNPRDRHSSRAAAHDPRRLRVEEKARDVERPAPENRDGPFRRAA
jgi:hypothetical protein